MKQGSRGNNSLSFESLNNGRIEESMSSCMSSHKKQAKYMVDEQDEFIIQSCIPMLFNSPSNLSTPSRKPQQPRDKTRTLKIKGKGRLYEQICAICLHSYESSRAQLPCKHNFCFSCITEWIKSSTSCPCCRLNFSELRKVSSESDEVIKVQEKKFQFNEDDYYICYNCGRGDNQHVLLVCDRCDFYCCHVYCDGRLGDEIPEGDWFCRFCLEREGVEEFLMLTENSQSSIHSNRDETESLSSGFDKPVANRTRSRMPIDERSNHMQIFHRMRRRR